MSDLFVMPSENKYGIESWKNLFSAADAAWGLVELTYLDDRKFASDDLIDLVTVGPKVITEVIKAAGTSKDLGKEATDLTEGEKAELTALFGDKIKNPAYMKIFRGLADVADGISEAINPANPTD